MKNQNIIIFVLLLAIAGALIYLFKDKLKAFFQPKGNNTSNNNAGGFFNTGNEAPASTGNSGTIAIPSISTLNTSKLLKKGSKGPEVLYLQNMLNGVMKLQNFTPLVLDGNFGTKTENALYYYTQVKQITISQAATYLVQNLGK